MDYWGGKYVSVCKAWGKLGGSGGMLPWGNGVFFDVLVDTILWNLGLFFFHKHNSPFIVSLKLLYKRLNRFTCKIEFSAYPRGGNPNPREGNAPPPPSLLKETLVMFYFVATAPY